MTQTTATATLLVGDSSTSCSACGGNASYSDTHHVHGGLHDHLGKTNGCGALFVAIASDDCRVDEETLEELRPDLEIV